MSKNWNQDNSVAMEQKRQLYLFMMEDLDNCSLYKIGEPPADSSGEASVRPLNDPLLMMEKPDYPDYPIFTAIDSRIFIIGGRFGACSSNKVFIYDTLSSKVVSGPDLNAGKNYPYLFTFGSKIFALSRYMYVIEKGYVMDSNPRFEMLDTDVREPKWSPLPVPMLHVSSDQIGYTLSGAAAVLVNGSPVIFISLKYAGTYCFEVDNLVWYYVGPELLPFNENAVSIPQLPSMCCAPSLNSKKLAAFHFCYEGNGKGFQVNEIMVRGYESKNLPPLGGPPLMCDRSLPLVFGPDNRVYAITTGVDKPETCYSPPGNRYVKVYALDFKGINLDQNVPRSFKRQKLIAHGEDQDETTDMCTNMDWLIGLDEGQDETVEVALNKGQSSKSWEGNNETTEVNFSKGQSLKKYGNEKREMEVNISKGQSLFTCGNEKREMKVEEETKECLKLVELSCIWGECFFGGPAFDETFHVLGAIAM